jgi:predicted Zn finger-like uncharacterized protein
MYIVQCPKCQQRMKVKNEMHQVKVRCAHCKEVFLAETEKIGDSPAPASAKPAAAGAKSAPKASRPSAAASDFAPAPAPKAEEPVGIDLGSFAPKTPAAPGTPAAERKPPRVLRKKSNAPMFVVIGGGVVCIVIFCIVVWLNTTAVYRFPDGHTERLSNSRIAELIEKDKEEANAPAAAPAKPAVETGSVEKTFFAKSQPASNPFDDMPLGEGPDAISTEKAEAMSDVMPLPDKDKNKDKLGLIRPTIFPNEQDAKSGVVAGVVQNLSDSKTIKTLNLSFDIINKVNDKDRVVGHTMPIKVENVPPSSLMRYSVQYQLNAVGKFLRPKVTQLDYAPDNTVSWMVPSQGLQFDTAPNVLKVTGTAKNNTASTVRDVQIYATFFNSQGEEIGSSEPSKLQDDKTLLIKDGTGRFVVRLDLKGKIEEAKTVDIRVVGTKE